MDKPKYLYHASSHNNLKVLKPQEDTRPRDFSEGPVVFATDCFAFSTEFIVPTDDSWANGGAFNDVSYFIISDKNRFLKVDKGGSIYLVPSTTFKKYNRKEWFSTKPVKTVSKVKFNSGLEAMIIRRVQVYFVNKTLYQKIQESDDHGLSILNTLTSENEKWGMKVSEFDLYKGSKRKTS